MAPSSETFKSATPQTQLPLFFSENQILSKHTYYCMGGKARYLAHPRSFAEVQQTIFWCREHSLPCALLGSGSNSVYSDDGFPGVVLSLANLIGWHWECEDTLFAEAGVTNTEIAEICLAFERHGAGWMYRMPGQLGASIRMNARCYGGEMSHIIQEVYTLNPHGEFCVHQGKDIFHGYKKTLFMQQPEVIIGARLRFPCHATHENIISFMQQCERDRHEKHHFDWPSCGSTFKNNYAVGVPSGKIFDKLGLKGVTCGNLGISDFHANFIWNFGNAKTADWVSLVGQMRAQAFSEAQAELDLEAQPTGLFSTEDVKLCGMEKLGISYKDDTTNSGIQRWWVGLFWHPQLLENQHTSFPRTLFACPFFEYHRASGKGLPTVWAKLVQRCSLNHAQKYPAELFLEWVTETIELPDHVFSLVSAQHIPLFQDKLWHVSVSELFLAKDIFNQQTKESGTPHYLEFETTPQGHWLAIEFDDIRKRKDSNQVPCEDLWPGITPIPLGHCDRASEARRFFFGLGFSYLQIEKILNKQTSSFKIQCALSLGQERYFLAPFWSQCDEEKHKETPDFHQPERFWRVKVWD